MESRKEKHKKNRKILIILKDWIPSLFFAIILTIVLKNFVIDSAVIPTGSMENTIQVNDRIFVNKMINANNLSFGDIVVFYPPNEDNDKKYIKRLIGLPGDIIEIKNGYLYRNNKKIKESYVKEVIRYQYGPIEVPKEHYFLLGDNRNNSLDSHLWNNPFVYKNDIIGKALLVYYPFNHIKIF